jgi:hypothetical protein
MKLGWLGPYDRKVGWVGVSDRKVGWVGLSARRWEGMTILKCIYTY